MYVLCKSFCLWLISLYPCTEMLGTCLSCACTAIVHQGSYVVVFFTYILDFDFMCDVVQVLLTLL